MENIIKTGSPFLVSLDQAVNSVDLATSKVVNVVQTAGSRVNNVFEAIMSGAERVKGVIAGTKIQTEVGLSSNTMFLLGGLFILVMFTKKRR